MEEINKIIVAGAGVMGAGISQVCAMKGFKVQLYDISDESLQKGKETILKNLNKAISIGKATEEIKEKALLNIALTSDLDKLDGDMVIEAVIERLDIKAKLFNDLL